MNQDYIRIIPSRNWSQRDGPEKPCSDIGRDAYVQSRKGGARDGAYLEVGKIGLNSQLECRRRTPGCERLFHESDDSVCFKRAYRDLPVDSRCGGWFVSVGQSGPKWLGSVGLPYIR